MRDFLAVVGGIAVLVLVCEAARLYTREWMK